MDIVWSPAARDEADDAAAYIGLASPGEAVRWLHGLFAAVERLRWFPESGPRLPELADEGVRVVPYGAYRIFYRAVPDGIRILAVRHARRHLDPAEFPRM